MLPLCPGRLGLGRSDLIRAEQRGISARTNTRARTECPSQSGLLQGGAHTVRIVSGGNDNQKVLSTAKLGAQTGTSHHPACCLAFWLIHTGRGVCVCVYEEECSTFCISYLPCYAFGYLRNTVTSDITFQIFFGNIRDARAIINYL